MKLTLGLGSNIGDRLANIRSAIHALDEVFTVTAVSRIYESKALTVDSSKQDPDFLNAAVLVESDLPAREILKTVKAIEVQLGRKSAERWAPRPIDIDLLAADQEISEEGLRLPHAALADRPFALLPLADLWPEFRFESGETARARVDTLGWREPSRTPLETRRTLDCLAQLVGIVNVTPDSFSDGGKFLNPSHALERCAQLLENGAQILDIGAESTRPGAAPVDSEEEWRRLAPVLSKLQGRAILSVDTRHAETARRALELGANWINDVSACENPELASAVAKSSATLVCMHSLGVPPSPDRIVEGDPMRELARWGVERKASLAELGIPSTRLILDSGIGFGKTREQNWELLGRNRELKRAWRTRILIGHSRKSFLSSMTSLPPEARDLESATISAELALGGADFLRVHDPALSLRAIRARVAMSDRLR